MYVYFIKNQTGATKIGVSGNPLKRLANLQTSNPETLQLVYIVPCDSKDAAYALEKSMHTLFGRYNSIGEWFRLPPNWIKQLPEEVVEAAKNAFDLWDDAPRAYLTLAQKREVVNLINEAGLYLLDFYISKGSVPQYEYTDARTALAIGWNLKKVADYRRKLESVDLFRQEVYGSGEHKAVVTYLADRFKKGYKGKTPIDPLLVESDDSTEVVDPLDN